MTTTNTPKAGDVPSSIYDAFLTDLEGTAVDPGTIEKLRDVLRSGKPITELALRGAIEPTVTDL